MSTAPHAWSEDLKVFGLPAGEDGRKRALKACLSCRSRKVRCDVSVVSQPCTNCQLHGKNCLVTGRGSRLDAFQPQDACDNFELEQDSGLPEDQLSFHVPSESSRISSEQLSGSRSYAKNGHRGSPPPSRPSSLPRSSCTITFSHFRFLTLGNLHRIPFEDVNYLESQGCLHVPVPPILDDFVQHYFLHIHPLLPIVDEGDFWDMYSQADTNRAPGNTMSLLLFQAMLFSSCTFVPFASIQRLGFSSLRSARGEFYRRVKLLHDMETENSPLPLAQAALLLMAWVPPSNLTLIPYKMWLGRAVQYSKSLNADRVANDNSSATTKNQKALRRLWWCCVVMDRISPLCCRFYPYIHHELSDFESSAALVSEDLRDEVFRSSVYNPASKQRLLSVFEVYLKFIVILTDVLSVSFPFAESLDPSSSSERPRSAKVDECISAMKSWLACAMTVIPPSTIATANPSKKENLHKSVSVHVNLIYIYYYHSSIALSHTRLLRLVKSNMSKNVEASELGLIRDDLQGAAESMTQLFADLDGRRLVRWLPISALCCMVFPLAFCVVTARLRAANTSLAMDDAGPTSSNDRDLSVLMGTIKSFLPQYDGVDLIKETVKHAAELAHAAGQALSKHSAATPPTSWTQILVGDPELYLKMVMSIDLSINKGRLVEEDDFPAGLFSKMRLDAASNHPWQTLGSDIPPDFAVSGMVPNINSSWELWASAVAQREEAPLSTSRIEKAGTSRIGVGRTKPAWEGSLPFASTDADSLWGCGSMSATDQLSGTLEPWTEMPLWDLELVDLAWE
ncbi:uncharacterized protein B0I36DRAFT_238761 [Microdochium trichocladiopsis]|uniref:Zn(2)-C6 fungal-type domain-containing protein n=1 Tax=Microdochium trichocladiopsis TaxID=1682393 RepID=A0A9P9BU20_9PEZI|nr:uncharacterized protein B0I36DRAFT_238761 [Microdochium trichocladiopsis]KAH7036032.1 hypothetical protein B0I36DRAFT_238761 [Microdochium trichocladiopsis]